MSRASLRASRSVVLADGSLRSVPSEDRPPTALSPVLTADSIIHPHIHHAEFEALPHTIQRDVVLFHRRHRWDGSHHLTPSRFNQHRVDRCRNYFHRRPTPKGALPTINVP